MMQIQIKYILIITPFGQLWFLANIKSAHYLMLTVFLS